jgi:hypothetical protein
MAILDKLVLCLHPFNCAHIVFVSIYIHVQLDKALHYTRSVVPTWIQDLFSELKLNFMKFLTSQLARNISHVSFVMASTFLSLGSESFHHFVLKHIQVNVPPFVRGTKFHTHTETSFRNADNTINDSELNNKYFQ